MNKFIRRVSLAVAMLICLQGFACGVAEDDALVEPSATPVQENQAIPEPTQEAEVSPVPTAEITEISSHEPTTETAEPMPEVTAEVTLDPSVEPTEEETVEPSEETAEPSVEPEVTPEASETPAPEYVCGLEEHIHDSLCYDEEQNLICTIPEHTHSDSCLAENPDASSGLIVAPYVDPALWKGVRPSDERGMAIPMLFQFDYREVVCTLNGVERSVSTSGCGATSMSMVIAYLTGNTEQNPYMLFRDSVLNGRYHGEGWSHETLSHYASAYDIHSKWISNDADMILYALANGYPVIAHMGDGIFTENGHYLVLRGLTEDGLVLLNDPNSQSNCELAFPISSILKQAKTSDSFMVCWNDDMEDFHGPEKEKVIESTEIWGDLNGSGTVDINDVQLLFDSIENGETDESYDLNGDGAVDTLDTDALINAILTGEEGGASA